MIVAAKCNITLSILGKLNELHWGVRKTGLDNIILENYIEFLGFSKMEICHPRDCNNDTIVFTCNLNINKISKAVNENVIVFFIEDNDIIGGKVPYTYRWTYEIDDFDNSGQIDIDKATLTVKMGKKLELLVTKVSVKITDSNNCTYNKICYLTPIGLQCAENFVPCSNVTNLQIINKERCVGVSGLVINKKI